MSEYKPSPCARNDQLNDLINLTQKHSELITSTEQTTKNSSQQSNTIKEYQNKEMQICG